MFKNHSFTTDMNILYSTVNFKYTFYILDF